MYHHLGEKTNERTNERATARNYYIDRDQKKDNSKKLTSRCIRILVPTDS